MNKELRKFFISVLPAVVMLAGAFCFSPACASEAVSGPVFTLSVEGSITPFTYYQVKNAIALAEKNRARCLVLLMDTPGGLLASTRKIVQEIFASEIPVVCYVSPKGAQCASAGTFIALACHVVAMAPATNIGAASPVSFGGDMGRTMEKKVMNDTVSFIRSIARQRGRNENWAEKAVRDADSLPAADALDNGVIDCVAADLPDLFHKIEGLPVFMPSGKKMLLSVKGAEVKPIASGFTENILRVLGEPNVAYILMIIGVWGIILEFSHPGFGVPGVVGTISLILAFFAFQTFTQSIAGMLLIIVGVVLFLIELFNPGFGLFAISGFISLALGSLMLLRGAGSDYTVSLFLVLGLLVASALVLWAIFSLVASNRRRKVTTGNEGMLGEAGRVVAALDPEGMVFVHGEYWKAFADMPLAEGSRVMVVAVDGLMVKVAPLEGSDEKIRA